MEHILNEYLPKELKNIVIDYSVGDKDYWKNKKKFNDMWFKIRIKNYSDIVNQIEYFNTYKDHNFIVDELCISAYHLKLDRKRNYFQKLINVRFPLRNKMLRNPAKK